jgi:pyruvate carboxylase
VACELPLDDQQLASYLMYPKQTADFHAHVRTYSDTSVLPTPAFLYGLQQQEEVAVDIDAGKTLLISLQGRHADGNEGMVKVQFELNGQSRTAVVEQRNSAQVSAVRQGRAVADLENPLHIAAPMPGSVVAVAVQPGQRVVAGSTLIALEAMKMETHISADRDCVVAAVHIQVGDRVAPKDLLIELHEASD